jgi:asparagine synthase (glutamine-hydrolysing)
MCGIAGFVGRGTRDDVQRMCQALHHRGPDAQDIWMRPEQGLALGHARLSVLDHVGGAQPMWLPDGGIGIVFNGEIYNFAALRKELELLGCQFQSNHSDTEVVLQAYALWGDDCVQRFNGMWAFVVIDFRRKRLFASRDRFGKKPFYYSASANGLVFASELGALCQHSGISAQVDGLSVKKYFAYGYIPAPRTPYQNIFKLPAGNNLSYSFADRQLTVSQYWRYSINAVTSSADDEDQLAERLLALLDQAVQRRLVADVPVGTFLSGGLDSSTVSALAARSLGAGRLKTFSIGFNEASFDESAHARATAKLIGSEHHELQFQMDEAASLAQTIISHVSDPFADSSVLPTYLVSQLARKHVTVALGGDGADELFAGYGPFQALRWASWLTAVCPQPGISLLSNFAKQLPVSHDYMNMRLKLTRALAGVQQRKEFWLPSWMSPVGVGDVNHWVDDGVVHSAQEIFSETSDAWNACTSEHLVDKASEFFTTLYMQNNILAKVDQASMMHSLEVRAPFLDIDVANFAASLPHPLKLHGKTTKYLLKKAAQPLLPEMMRQRKKQGFAVPIARWFATGELKIDMQKIPAILNKNAISNSLNVHARGTGDESLALWAVMALGTLNTTPLSL